MKHRWAFAAAAAATAAAGYRTVLGPWHQRWGASEEEAGSPLPGDDLVAEPATQATRAITVRAPADQVWPWVVQLGADRGGFYSYDWLENLFGLGIHSADRIHPDWQRRAVGDLVYADAAGTGGWYVVQVVPGEVLVLKLANVAAGHPARRDEQLRWEFLWTFATRDQGDGTTRLLVRERTGFGSVATRVLMSPLGLVSFVMTQKTMRGIKARAEAGEREGRRAVVVLERVRTRIEHELDTRSVATAVWAYRRTRGRLTRLWGRRAIVLTTTGRRSGRPRTVLVQVFPDGQELFVVAANSGLGRPPGWYHNLRAHPRLEADLDGAHLQLHAHLLTEPEATGRWQQVLATAPDYARYARRTGAIPPIFRLHATGEQDQSAAARGTAAPVRAGTAGRRPWSRSPRPRSRPRRMPERSAWLPAPTPTCGT